jgi:hypothetical protein
MTHLKSRWTPFILAAFLLGSSCRLGTALQPTPPLQPQPSPPSTFTTAPDGTGELEKAVPASPTGTGELEMAVPAGPTAPPLAVGTPTPTRPSEQPVIQIPLAGPVTAAEAEISGMAWYGDTLVMLPQYPERMSEGGKPGVLYSLPRSSILEFLDGESQDPLVPAEIPFISPDLKKQISDYEGFEAVAFIGDRVFLTIESGEYGPMMSYLVAGTVTPGLVEVFLDIDTLLSIPPQVDLINRGEEALVVAGDWLLSLFETNGARILPSPVAHRIDPDSFAVDTVPFPNVEYRITDATPADADGRFWALNTFFPGDLFIIPLTDPIAQQFGQGATHARQLAVERLLQMQVTPGGISLAGTPPIQLELLDSFQGRNWEGLVELPGRGFLLMTDRHPETILAFVPLP